MIPESVNRATEPNRKTLSGMDDRNQSNRQDRKRPFDRHHHHLIIVHGAQLNSKGLTRRRPPTPTPSWVGIQCRADDNYARKFCAAVVDLVLNFNHVW